MYRIRFHGRGGQGIKTASRILGTAFFMEGFEVQDAPRYGAERRGAPIFAYVRASRKTINERGVIKDPGLVIVADDSLVGIPGAGVLQGLAPDTVLLILSADKPDDWKERLNFTGRLFTLPVAKAGDTQESAFIGASCVGAAARLIGVITRTSLEQAIREELEWLGPAVVEMNLQRAFAAYDLVADSSGCIAEGSVPSPESYTSPAWIELPFEDARISAPTIHAAATSEEVHTGLWRTMRPVIDQNACHRCWWLCSTFCPDSAIKVNAEGYPEIDYGHCKGCMICVAQCPTHAISAVPETGTKGGGDEA